MPVRGQKVGGYQKYLADLLKENLYTTSQSKNVVNKVNMNLLFTRLDNLSEYSHNLLKILNSFSEFKIKSCCLRATVLTDKLYCKMCHLQKAKMKEVQCVGTDSTMHISYPKANILNIVGKWSKCCLY